MKHLLIAISVLALSMGSKAQEYSYEFGKLGNKEKSMTSCVFDKKAEAVVLFDIGESSFLDTNEGFKIRFERRRRIKVLMDAGSKHAEVVIPLYRSAAGRKEELVELEAWSYKEVDGIWQRFKVENGSVFDEKLNNSLDAKKFTFPRVGPGTIIEYRAVIESPFLFRLPDWQFQDEIPTMYSKYQTKMVPFYEYAFITKGISRFHSQHSYQDPEERTWGTVSGHYGSSGTGFNYHDMVYEFVMINTQAFRDESFITSRQDYIASLDFQLSQINRPDGTKEEIITSWEEMVEDNLKYTGFGKYIKKSKGEAGRYLKAHPGLMQKEAGQRARELIYHVKNSFEWDGYYRKFAVLTPKQFAEQKKGSSAEMNLYLVALLRAAGIEAYPVLISTRNHGRIDKKYPFEHFLNHVVVNVILADDSYLADATSRLLAYDRIPPRCINGEGLIMAGGPVQWLPLSQKAMSEELFELKLSPDPLLVEAGVQLKVTANEYEGYAYRNGFEDDMEELKRFFKKEGFSEVKDLSTSNYHDPSLAYEIQAEGRTEIGMLDGQLMISPFLNLPYTKSPFIQAKRSYPVDMTYARTHRFRAEIKVPEGYRAGPLPENYLKENDLVHIAINYRAEEGMLLAEGAYSFKQAVYATNDYPKLRYYLNQIVKHFNEPVLLIKND